jgi:hypothetical protein
MSTVSLVKELKVWINGDPERVKLMEAKAPIGSSTLKSTLAGRYNPGPLLQRAIKAVMAEYPLEHREKVVS